MKKELSTYDPIYGFTEYDDWSYCVDNKMWYEDKEEPLPMPLQNSELINDFMCNIKMNHDGVWGDTWEELTEDIGGFEKFVQYLLRENDVSDCTFSGILFKAPNQEQTIIFNDYGLIEFNEFIKKLKKYNFATQYFEDAYFCKFIAWSDDTNNTRFVIYSYREDYRYLEILFDITVPKNILVSKLENIIDIWKQKMHNVIIDYLAKSNKQIVDIRLNKLTDYFFPEFVNKTKD